MNLYVFYFDFPGGPSVSGCVLAIASLRRPSDGALLSADTSARPGKSFLRAEVLND